MGAEDRPGIRMLPQCAVQIAVRAATLAAPDFTVSPRRVRMAEGVYRVTEVVGVSSESW
jgi:hypothetical protein